MKLFGSIYAYTWGRAFQDSSNCYIILDEECLLIDPGTYKSYTNLRGLMRNDKIESVDYVFNTHLHRDHCESNRMFDGALFGFDEKDRTVSMFGYRSDIKPKRSFLVGETEIEILRTPGHSPGSLTFFIPEYSTAITGDLIFEGGIPGRFDLHGGSRKEMIRSLEKLRELDAEYILPGHRRIMHGRDGIDAMLERCAELLTLL